MSKSYTYAIISSQGMYGSGDKVRAVKCGNDIAKMQAAAKKMTREYQDGMRKYGGSSGGYRVVRWDAERSYVLLGHEADRYATV